MNIQDDIFDGLNFPGIVEALIFASPRPISADELCSAIMDAQEGVIVEPSDITGIIDVLNQAYAQTHRAFRILFVGGGYTFATEQRYHKWLQAFQHANANRKLTPSALETLAIIAYKQPITKPGVDHIRRVDSAYVVKQLLEKELIEVCGRADAPGRPLLYRTSRQFLTHFGLNSIDDLPKPREIEEILKDDEMAEHRQFMLELRTELAQPKKNNETKE